VGSGGGAAGKAVVRVGETTGPGGCAGYQSTFAADWGVATPPLFDRAAAFVGGSWFASNLSNSGDAVILKNAMGTTIDEMSYGGSTLVFSPAVPDDGAGNAAQRLGYPWALTLGANTGATSWANPASGFNLCKIASDGTPNP